MRRDSPTDSDAKKFASMSMAGRRQPWFGLSEDAEDEDQYVFTSMRWDCKAKPSKENIGSTKEMKCVYLFKYHYDRLYNAAQHRGWYDAVKSASMKKLIDLYHRVQREVEKLMQDTGSKGPFKVRVMLRYHGNVEVKVLPEISSIKHPCLYPTTFRLSSHPDPASRRADVFKVVLDALPTNRCLHTKDKTEWRHMYDYARLGASIQSYQDAKEVLLFNGDGQIMDASISTPYFFRNGKWVTPHNDCGGQTGATRRWALDHDLCNFGIVTVDSLVHNETIWLSNAVKGFFTARYVTSSTRCQAPSFRSTSFSSTSSYAETTGTDIVPKAML